MKKNYNSSLDGRSAEDRALDRFAEVMIEKIESLSERDQWQKPWFSGGAGRLEWPKNMDGREYNGKNAVMLLLLCQKMNYEFSRFCTFNWLQRLNEKDEDQPKVMVLKGERSFPVFLFCPLVINKDTKQKIKYEDYLNMSYEEQLKYNFIPMERVYNVFNVAQTNMQAARPDLWEKIEAGAPVAPTLVGEDGFRFPAVDDLITNNGWICPINPTEGDQAYFSLTSNEIVVPLYNQFKDGESFYGNLFHEMAHSTGHKDCLDRLKPAKFGSPDYAKEELVAELTAALVCSRYGMEKNLKEDSAKYLKAWLQSLRQDAKYIKTVLADVKKASDVLTAKIDGKGGAKGAGAGVAKTKAARDTKAAKAAKTTGELFIDWDAA